MDHLTRSAVVARYGAIAGPDAIVPHSWEEINNIALQLEIDGQDPELAQVLKGKMTASLEQEVLCGAWSAEPPAKRDFQAERQEAIAKALESLPVKSPEELAAEQAARNAESETARRNSLRLVGLG